MNSAYVVQAVFEGIDNLSGTIGSIESKLGSLGSSMKRVGTIATGALTVPLAAAGVSSLNLAMDAERLTLTLEGLAGGAVEAASYITAIESASRGTISQVDALAIANSALQFGIVENADEMARLTEVAITLGRAQGMTAEQSVADMTTALARQNTEILDNLGITMLQTEAYGIYADMLGITVGELTEMQKAEAFRIAALEKGMGVVEQMGGMQDDTASSLERFNATIKNAKVLIGNALLPVFERLLGFLQPAIDWFTGLDSSTMGLIVTIGGLVAAIGPLLIILGSVIGAIGTIVGVIGGPALLVIGAIVGAVGILGAAFATNFGGVRDAVMGAWEQLAPIVEEIRIWFMENLPIAIEQFRAFAEPIVTEVVAFITAMFQKVVDWFVANWPLIQETFQTIVSAIQSFWDEHGAAILNAITCTWESIKSVISTALDIVLGLVRTIMQMINGDWEGAWETIKGIGESIWETIKTVFTNFLESVLGFLGQNLDQFIETWRTNFEMAHTIVDEVLNRIREFIGNFSLVDMGKKLVQGLIDGVKSMAESLVNSVRGVVDDAIQGAKNLLGIESPSRVFAWMGQMSMAGLAGGILDMQSIVARATAGAVGETVRVAGRAVAAGLSAAADNRRYDQSRTYNSTVHVNGVGLGTTLQDAMRQV